MRITWQKKVWNAGGGAGTLEIWGFLPAEVHNLNVSTQCLRNTPRWTEYFCDFGFYKNQQYFHDLHSQAFGNHRTTNICCHRTSNVYFFKNPFILSILLNNMQTALAGHPHLHLATTTFWTEAFKATVQQSIREQAAILPSGTPKCLKCFAGSLPSATKLPCASEADIGERSVQWTLTPLGVTWTLLHITHVETGGRWRGWAWSNVCI